MKAGGCFIQQAEHSAFTIDGWQCGYADIYVTSPDTQTDSSILWNTFFGDIKTRHDLNSGDKQCRQFLLGCKIVRKTPSMRKRIDIVFS